MIDLNKILEMWKKDSVIDKINLDESSKESAKLHSKYLELLSIVKLQLKKKEHEQKLNLLYKVIYLTKKSIIFVYPHQKTYLTYLSMSPVNY